MPQSKALAIYLPDGQVTPPINPYGRLIANAGTYRALAQSGQCRRLHVQSRPPGDPWEVGEELGILPNAVEVTTGSLLGAESAARAGTLLSGQPYLSEPAWVRRHAGRDTAYSIVGTIFAYASATHRELMMHSALAPLQEWDALVCSSPTLRQTVADTFDRWEDYLRQRLSGDELDTPSGNGARRLRLPRPQLPVIPFGSDVEKIAGQAADSAARAYLRTALGIGSDDVMVYFLGRLSYYDKAFPQAMIKAVQAAGRRTGVTTHFVMTGWFPEGPKDRRMFEEVVSAYAPGLSVTFLDGNDPVVVGQCWAAADIFLLLSDTILETFGQALVEAMAAGVPVVVSDWDGYRSIVRDGREGFLVPTMGAPSGALGESLALLQATGMIGYPQYAGAVAQHTAVSVEAAAQALEALIASPDLRREMGAAGQYRAREHFSWPVVASQYSEVFTELAAIRARAEQSGELPSAGHRSNPLRGDPFLDFRTLPTTVLTDDTALRLAPGHADRAAGSMLADPIPALDGMFPGLRGSASEAESVLELLEVGGSQSVGQVLSAFPARRRAFVRMTIMWLAKAGAVEWVAPD